MLCEENGLFLEIAQVIRGLELTILKGVMENRLNKSWAHFIVEVHIDPTVCFCFFHLRNSCRINSYIIVFMWESGINRIPKNGYLLALDEAIATEQFYIKHTMMHPSTVWAPVNCYCAVFLHLPGVYSNESGNL